MAKVSSIRGTKLLIKVSDGGSPTPVFAHPCMINSDRGISFTASTNDQEVPDCDNPDLMAWAEREKVSLSAQISGNGILHTKDISFFSDWLQSPDSIAVRVEFDGVDEDDGGGWWAGNFHCTGFDANGGRGKKAEGSITLISDGPVVWVPAT